MTDIWVSEGNVCINRAAVEYIMNHSSPSHWQPPALRHQYRPSGRVETRT